MRSAIFLALLLLTLPSILSAQTSDGLRMFHRRDCYLDRLPTFTTAELEFLAEIPECPNGILSLSFRIADWPSAYQVLIVGQTWDADVVEGDPFSGLTLRWDTARMPEVHSWHDLGEVQAMVMNVDPFFDPHVVYCAEVVAEGADGSLHSIDGPPFILLYDDNSGGYGCCMGDQFNGRILNIDPPVESAIALPDTCAFDISYLQCDEWPADFSFMVYRDGVLVDQGTDFGEKGIRFPILDTNQDGMVEVSVGITNGLGQIWTWQYFVDGVPVESSSVSKVKSLYETRYSSPPGGTPSRTSFPTPDAAEKTAAGSKKD